VTTGLRVVVLGYIVRGPLGGLAWHHLQYVLGLARLGHDVYFLEDSDDYPACYDPVRNVTDTDPTYGLDFAARTFDRVGLGERWAYHDAHTGRWLGPAAGSARDVFATADLLLNLSGVNPLRPWAERVPMRVLIDTDPAFTQIRHLSDPAARARAKLHTAFFSFGENLAAGRSQVPADGFPWRPTRQPIVMEAWPVTQGPARGNLTTVLQWESYPARSHGGRRYGLKAESFSPYLDMPARVGPVFELALGGPTAPRDLLRQKGWGLRDSQEVTRDPWTYQRYLAESRAEFSVAKAGYVDSWSGWFSERSAGYLASGRPVLVQDTGFTDWLPTGEGALAFRTPEEAVAGVEALDRRYEHHCRVARELAQEYFDARKVLAALVEDAWSPPGGPSVFPPSR